MTLELNEEDPFEAVLIEMVKLNRSKRADYAGADWWTQNFYDSAYQCNMTAGQSCEQLIATKQARLRVLTKPGAKPKNESIRDTRLDRAVYSVISVGLHDEGGYDNKELTVSWVD